MSYYILITSLLHSYYILITSKVLHRNYIVVSRRVNQLKRLEKYPINYDKTNYYFTDTTPVQFEFIQEYV